MLNAVVGVGKEVGFWLYTGLESRLRAASNTASGLGWEFGWAVGWRLGWWLGCGLYTGLASRDSAGLNASFCVGWWFGCGLCIELAMRDSTGLNAWTGGLAEIWDGDWAGGLPVGCAWGWGVGSGLGLNIHWVLTEWWAKLRTGLLSVLGWMLGHGLGWPWAGLWAFLSHAALGCSSAWAGLSWNELIWSGLVWGAVGLCLPYLALAIVWCHELGWADICWAGMVSTGLCCHWPDWTGPAQKIKCKTEETKNVPFHIKRET
jgi:hypothetical protein